MTLEEKANLMFWCGHCVADIHKKTGKVPEDIMRAHQMLTSRDSEMVELGVLTMVELIKNYGYDPEISKY